MNNELMKVEVINERQTVLGRDLYKFLEVETQYKDWIKRMISYGFVSGIDFEAIAQKRATVQGNQTTLTNHQLTLDMAKEISMLQRTEKGRQARKYFIECERKLKEKSNQIVLPKNYVEALKALVIAEEDKITLQEKITEQKPKVDYYNRVLHSDKLITFTEVAKDLGISSQKLHKQLHLMGYIYKKGSTYHLYQKYNDLLPTHFDYHITEYGQILKITEKGRKLIIDISDGEKGNDK